MAGAIVWPGTPASAEVVQLLSRELPLLKAKIDAMSRGAERDELVLRLAGRVVLLQRLSRGEPVVLVEPGTTAEAERIIIKQDSGRNAAMKRLAELDAWSRVFR